MTTSIGIHPETRLFEPFLDPVDMVVCVPAVATVEEINRQLADQNLRFPLFCDSGKTLSDHLCVTEFTSCSSRFGSLTDNILGMNWQLPNGTLARVGERIVKSTTGYDIRRFLLASSNDYGFPTHYVLRLRPLCDSNLSVHLTGNQESLIAVAREIRLSSWSHWIDQCDLLFQQNGSRIELATNCPEVERSPFREFVQSISTELEVTEQSLTPQSLPVFSIKATHSLAASIAQECVEQLGGTARWIANAAAVLVSPERVPGNELLSQWNEALLEVGGHIHGLSEQPFSQSQDALGEQWEELLKSQWKEIV